MLCYAKASSMGAEIGAHSTDHVLRAHPNLFRLVESWKADISGFSYSKEKTHGE